MWKNEKTGLGRALVKHHNHMIHQSKEKGRFFRNQHKKVETPSSFQRLIHPLPPAVQCHRMKDRTHIEDTWMQEINANRPPTPTWGRPPTKTLPGRDLSFEFSFLTYQPSAFVIRSPKFATTNLVVPSSFDSSTKHGAATSMHHRCVSSADGKQQ